MLSQLHLLGTVLRLAPAFSVHVPAAALTWPLFPARQSHRLPRRRDRPRLLGVLRALGAFLPGDHLKTAVYRTLIAKPRHALRQALTGFYRIDLLYQLLEESRQYEGQLSILEFGTHRGYAFTKMLFATRYLGLQDRVTVHAFDSFEGLPPAMDRRDQNVITNDEIFVEGQYRGNLNELERYCRGRYPNYVIHPGYFEDVLTPQELEPFREQLPILLWIDCDYYSSTRVVLERMLPFIPSGCAVYFDDYSYNFGSRLTGEARVVHELNQGLFGDGIELVMDRKLGADSNAVYRLVRFEGGPRYRRGTPWIPRSGRARGNDSALP